MKNALALALTWGLFTYTAGVAAAGDSAAGQQKAAVCAACHGENGNSVNPQWPSLAGQHASYLAKQLRNFRAGVRVNVQMTPMAAPLSDQDIDDLAAHFASQRLQGGFADPELVKPGQALYRGGDSGRGVPACMGCHDPAGVGNPAAKFPALAGQHAEYLAAQLTAFRSQERANDPNGMMRAVASAMTDHQIKAVASYIQGLRAGKLAAN